jgi:hypothetical protein
MAIPQIFPYFTSPDLKIPPTSECNSINGQHRDIFAKIVFEVVQLLTKKKFAIFEYRHFRGCLQKYWRHFLKWALPRLLTKKNGANFSRSMRQWFWALRTKRKVVLGYFQPVLNVLIDLWP